MSFLISINRPLSFDVSEEDNIIKEIDISFQNLCSSLEEFGIQTPRKLSTFEFWSKVDYFRNKKTSTQKE